jgi:hypothetical protein
MENPKCFEMPLNRSFSCSTQTVRPELYIQKPIGWLEQESIVLESISGVDEQMFEFVKA